MPCSLDGLEGVDVEAWLAVSSDLRRRNADLSGLQEETVRRALTDIIAIGEKTARRAGILATTRTPEHLERMERELYAAFDVAPSARRDVLADDGPDDGASSTDSSENSAAEDRFEEPDDISAEPDDAPQQIIRGRGIGRKFLTD